jgi:hypothetical protein
MAGVFITGATSGLGWALAIEAVKRGFPTGIVGRRRDRLDSLSSLLEKNGGTIFQAEGDVTDRFQMEEIAAKYLSDHGSPDFLFANAGIREAPSDAPGENGRAVMETNYFGAINSVLPFLPSMIERRRGQIIIISSLASKLSLPGAGDYCASKAAIDRWAGSKRLELATHQVYMTIVSPGFIETEMTRENPYPMPFMLTASRAAQIIFEKIQQKKGIRREITFPLPLSWAITFLTMMPASFQEQIFNHFMDKAQKPKEHQGVF